MMREHKDSKKKLIKICGLTTRQDVDCVNAFLPDFAGFVLFFPKSRRNLEISEAAALIARLNRSVKSVAVTVSPSTEQVAKIEEAGFDYIQIHGELDKEVYDSVRLPILRAFNVKDMDAFEEMQKLEKIVGYIFDSQNPGSGKTFDWSIMDTIPRDGRLLFLAGGIHDGNVREAITRVNPDGIDVSSAVEYAELLSSGDGGYRAEGKRNIVKFRGKDPEKMKKLIRMVHDEQ